MHENIRVPLNPPPPPLGGNYQYADLIGFIKPFQDGASLVDPFVIYVSCLMLSCLFIWALSSPVGKGLVSWLSSVCVCVCVCVSVRVCHFPMWCPYTAPIAQLAGRPLSEWEVVGSKPSRTFPKV